MTLEKWATWRELMAQPEIWRAWADRLDTTDLKDWVADCAPEQVWFCGAGSSAYIGEILAAGLDTQTMYRAVPTTDIVARPHALLHGKTPLVVQFGRSGDSAETLGTLNALDALATNANRLNITCNASGALAQRRGPGPGTERVVVLPPETHDAGFAMTSSFTTMLLSAAAVFDEQGSRPFAALAESLEGALPVFRDIAEESDLPERIVFLGSGPLTFVAREAALKVMELTAGALPALWDSALGFRHGPKSFVTPGTMIVLFRSADPTAARYEEDLAAELAAQFPDCPIRLLGAGHGLPQTPSDLWLAPLCVVLAQVLGVVWSDRMGLNVDDPFAGKGTLSRVVSGVKLYPVLR